MSHNTMNPSLIPHPWDGSLGYMRLSGILKIIPVSKSTWWAGVKSGKFPKPIKLAPRITVWRAADIADFLRNHGDYVYEAWVAQDSKRPPMYPELLKLKTE